MGRKMIHPKYIDYFEPVYPCYELETRHCPAILDRVCEEDKCARFKLKMEEAKELWIPEIDPSLYTGEYGSNG
jgi:hypothetical protein